MRLHKQCLFISKIYFCKHYVKNTKPGQPISFRGKVQTKSKKVISLSGVPPVADLDLFDLAFRIADVAI